jgi:hypothetical protein
MRFNLELTHCRISDILVFVKKCIFIDLRLVICVHKWIDVILDVLTRIINVRHSKRLVAVHIVIGDVEKLMVI